MKRLKNSQIAPVRNKLITKQKKICPLCDKKKTSWALDHNHDTGYIRDALCTNCNGMEGKIFNLAVRCVGKTGVLEFLKRLVAYHERHLTPQHGGYFHPTHKTEQEKRLARNKRARQRRAKLKGE